LINNYIFCRFVISKAAVVLKIMKADLTIRLLTYRRSISIRRNRARIQMDAAAEPSV
jgi:hypothetical protein